MGDLQDPRLMYLKAALFGVILLASAGLIVAAAPGWRAAGLVVLLAWSSARLYYFMFYVIEKYADPHYRFAGVIDFLRYAVSRRRARREQDSGAAS